MTDATARDVIAAWIETYFYGIDPGRRSVADADVFLSALVAAPESTRLDLARRLCAGTSYEVHEIRWHQIDD